MRSDPPLLLFYASRQIGGGEAYFINLGLAALKSGRRCVVVDYADGFVVARIPGAEHMVYSDEGGATYEGDCVACMPLGAAVFLGASLRLSPGARLLFISIHHHHAIELGNIGWMLRGLSPAIAGKIWPLLEPLRYRSIRRFFREIDASNGLAYCAPFQRDFDQAYLGLQLNGPLVPIPVPTRVASPVDTGADCDSIIWVSRLAKEKAEMISEIIATMVASRCERKLIIVGDGPERNRIEEQLKDSGISYEMPGRIAGAELVSFLRAKAFLCIGVGTAAIEMAMAGLPTLVVGLPGCHGGKFLWLHQTSPGDTIITSKSSDMALSINAAIAQISNQTRWHREANECMNAAFSRHGVDGSWDLLSKALDETTLSFAAACRLAHMDQQPFAAIRSAKQAIKNKFLKARK
jgi:glycosyltransferase involved in cell wall biosynthesis